MAPPSGPPPCRSARIGLGGECPHGCVVRDGCDSLSAFTPGERPEPEEGPEVVCPICGLPRQVIRIVAAERQDYPPRYSGE